MSTFQDCREFTAQLRERKTAFVTSLQCREVGRTSGRVGQLRHKHKGRRSDSLPRASRRASKVSYPRPAASAVGSGDIDVSSTQRSSSPAAWSLLLVLALSVLLTGCESKDKKTASASSANVSAQEINQATPVETTPETSSDNNAAAPDEPSMEAPDDTQTDPAETEETSERAVGLPTEELEEDEPPEIDEVTPEPLPLSSRMYLPTTIGLLLVDVEIHVQGQLLQDAFNAQIDQLLTDADVNKDDPLTWEEVFKHVSANPDRFGRQNATVNRSQYRQMTIRYDRNRNSRVEANEVARFLFRSAGSSVVPFRLSGTDYYRGLNRLESKLFAALDLDSNQRLSESEIDSATDSLRNLDPNSDQRIDLTEAMPTASPNQAMMNQGNPAWSRRRVHRRGDVAMDLENYVDWSTVSYAADSWRGMTGWFDGSAITTVDADGDSVISAEEAKTMREVSPDLRLRIDFDGQPKIEVISRHAGLQNAIIDQSSDGMLAIADESFCLQFAVSQRLNQQRNIPVNVFQMFDANNDGALDENEIPEEAKTQFSLEDYDSDGDGKLTLDEINNRQMENLPYWGVQVRARGAEFPDGVFSWLDQNHDLFLSSREMDAAPGRLRVHGKENIHPTDIPDTFLVQFVRGDPTQDNEAFQLQPAVLDQQQTDWPTWAKAMDSNQDGEITRQEFVGTKSMFNQVDRDNDNVINATEILSAEKMTSD